MKIFKFILSGVLMAALLFCLSACGEKDASEEIKKIEKPKTAATQDEPDIAAKSDAVEISPNVNGVRFNMTLLQFTQQYNEAKQRRGEGEEIINYNNWRKNGEPSMDENNVPVQYWYYDDADVSFTATVEINTQKLLNIGCGTTMNRFMSMTDDEKNSDIIIGKAALMAQIACVFPGDSEPVLQDIFYRTTTENNDTLWYSGFVFHLSTKQDKSDSKNNTMLFRVFPITDELKEEWKLVAY